MVSLQHFVWIIMVAQWSSYWYRMNVCVQATSVRTTAILYHFRRTRWKKYTLEISSVNIHIYTDTAEQPLQSLVSTASIVPLWSLLSNADLLSWATMVSWVYANHVPCAMMVTAVQSRPLTLYHVGHWCPLQTFTLWHGSHQCMFCNV
jgi:hypothetical protein